MPSARKTGHTIGHTRKARKERLRLQPLFSCLGRESNPHGRFGPRDFLATMAFATISVCGPDYSFTMGPGPLGVSCLVSAPSFFRRLGSRLPADSPGRVSLNLRHSTSLFSESALKCALSPSCLPFHHQGGKIKGRDGAPPLYKLSASNDYLLKNLLLRTTLRSSLPLVSASFLSVTFSRQALAFSASPLAR